MADYTDNQIAKTSGYIAKEAGVGFYNESVLISKVDNQYSDEYGSSVGGARTGNTIRVRFPAKFTTTDQIALDDTTIQAIDEQVKVLTLDTPVGIHAEVSIEQATLELEQGGSEYSERVLQPMGKDLVASVEEKGFEKLALESQNVIVMETPFSDADLLRQNFVKMRGLLDKQLAPKGDRAAYLGSDAEIEVANSVIPFFHSQREIDQAFKDGTMKRFGGLDWLASDLVYTRVNGAGGVAGATVSSYVEGSETMVLAAAVSGDLDALAVGDKLEFPASKLVNAQTKKAYGNVIQRAVKSVSGSGATVTITIDPIYGTGTAGRQNTDAVPVATNAVTILGTAGESYLCCPVFQKKGVTVASADLYLPRKVEMASKNKVMNIVQTFIRDYQIGSHSLPSRYECLILWYLLRPEWCGVLELKID